MLDPEASLYERLGGYDAIAAAVDDLLPTGVRQPKGVAFQYTCPAAVVVVVFRPPGAAALAAQLPADALPVTRLPT